MDLSCSVVDDLYFHVGMRSDCVINLKDNDVPRNSPDLRVISIRALSLSVEFEIQVNHLTKRENTTRKSL